MAMDKSSETFISEAIKFLQMATDQYVQCVAIYYDYEDSRCDC